MTDWTYTSLKTKVASALNKTNLTDHIVDFITQGEASLFRRIKIRQAVQSDDITISTGTYSVPYGMTEVISFTLTATPKRLEYMTPDRFDTLNLADGEPRFFTIINDQFHFAPSPSASYAATIRYRQKLFPLSTSNRTNWLLREHPDVYLNAALAEAAPFLRDDERVPMWEAKLNRIIAEINDNDPRPTTRLRNDDLVGPYRTFDITRG